MKQKYTIAVLCMAMILLSGCQSGEEENPQTMVETEALETGEYGASLPFTSSTSRQQHQIRSRSLVDGMNIGTGLLDLSTEHFSVKNYTIQEGQFLAYDELNSLLGRESDVNPDGLNPAKNSDFDTGNGIVKDAVLVRDIYEVDFLRDKEVQGVSLAIVFNSNLVDGASTINVKSELLQAYGEETARKLVSYIRKMPEIGDSMPIFVALYKDTSMDQTLPGSYFSQGYFEGRSSNFSLIQEEWVLFPGDAASRLNATVATQFTQVKNALNGYLPDDVSIIGKGKFVEGQLRELRISVDMYAKTATEALSLTQYLKSQLNTFTSREFRIQVEVKCQDETIATMIRAAGESEVIVNTLL